MSETTNTVWFASFDIGYRNMCFAIEEFDVDAISKLPKIAQSAKYNPDGTTTKPFGEVLRTLCVNSRTVYFKNTDLTGMAQKQLNPEVFCTLTDLLDEYKEYWDKCALIIIERQMQFKGVYNINALKIGQHCYSYFSFLYGRFKQIVDFPAYHKTQVLGAQKIKKINKKGAVSYKAVDKPARKKWAESKALAILAERNDFASMSKISSMKKKDDVSDCILQAIAAAYLILVEKSM